MSSITPNRYRDSAVVSSPSKILEQQNSSFAEEHALDAISKEANIRLQHQSEQNREARQIRYKELEKSIRDDDSSDSASTPLTPSTPIGSSRSRILSMDNGTNGINGTNIASLLQKFLNGDTDLRSIEQRDLRRLLSELEGKYKAAMIANSSMYNEKQALRYQVETFKDILEEHHETLNQAKRQLKEKVKDLDLEKRNSADLQQENNQLKEILASREKLIQESGMQIIMSEQINGNSNEEKCSSVLPIGLVSQETLSLLNSLGKGSIDEKFKNILNEKREQTELIAKLKSDLDEERNRSKLLEKQSTKLNDSHSGLNGSNEVDQQKHLVREINDLKLRLQRFETENSRLQQENKRYDAQQKTLKQQVLDAERKEEQLQNERRQLQKEFRDLKTRCDDALLEKQRLQDRIDSMEFIRRNYSSSRQLRNSSSNYTGGLDSKLSLPPAPLTRTGRAPSVTRYASVERETEASNPTTYRIREPSVSRRNSRDFSVDRWSTTNSRTENDFKTGNARRSDRWSTIITSPSDNQNSNSFHFSSLSGRFSRCILSITTSMIHCLAVRIFVYLFQCRNNLLNSIVNV